MSDTILVTGGAGFIGSHVVDALIAGGYTPRIYDAVRSPHHPDVDAVRADLTDRRALERALDDCSAVIHLAAAADVGEVAADPVEAERRNTRGTLSVLEAVRATGTARVVYASTIWVYSDVKAETVDEDTPLVAPAHFYTATKLAGELYCRSYQELYGVEYTVLRFGIPYGPRARGAAVVPQFVQKALDGKALTVAGDGSQSRAFVYVEDLAEGVVAALRPAAANRIYNLANPDEVTIAEIASTVQEVVAPVEIERVPGRSGDFKGAAVCSKRAAAELGWEARTPFREGLRRYVEWHTAVAPAPKRRLISLAAIAAAVLLGLWVLLGLAGIAALDPLADALGLATPLLYTVLALVPIAVAVFGGRSGRMACWGLAAAEFAVAILPWPGALGRAGHGHQVLLLVAALAATVAADAAGRGGLLRAAPERL